MSIRCRIADWLSRMACWLRGHKWYVADAWHGVPGNRAAELQQRLWQAYVLMWDKTDKEEIESVEQDLNELAQAAGQNWGHIWPKEKP